MEPRLVIAYGIMALIFMSVVVFGLSAARNRRKHRQRMSGRRIRD